MNPALIKNDLLLVDNSEFLEAKNAKLNKSTPMKILSGASEIFDIMSREISLLQGAVYSRRKYPSTSVRNQGRFSGKFSKR